MTEPTLADFLRARLDEDEAGARLASAGHPRWTGHVMDDVAGRTIYDDQWSVATVTCYEHNEPYSNDPKAIGPAYRNDAGDATSLHIARHDPARVLAEVEAKRRIVELHSAEPWEDDDIRCIACSTAWTGDWAPGPYEDRTAAAWPCATLRLLALPYAGHPSYREEWRP